MPKRGYQAAHWLAAGLPEEATKRVLPLESTTPVVVLWGIELPELIRETRTIPIYPGEMRLQQTSGMALLQPDPGRGCHSLRTSDA